MNDINWRNNKEAIMSDLIKYGTLDEEVVTIKILYVILGDITKTYTLKKQ